MALSDPQHVSGSKEHKVGYAESSTWLKDRGAVQRLRGGRDKGERGSNPRATTRRLVLSAQPAALGVKRHVRRAEVTPETHNQVTPYEVEATNLKQSLAWDLLLESVCWTGSHEAAQEGTVLLSPWP